MIKILAQFAWGCLITALAVAGVVLGTLFGDWRANRRGEPIDRGYWP